MSTLYRHAPGTIWRHALIRVERRSRAILAARHALEAQGIDGSCVMATHEYALLREAAILANRLAAAAGVTA